MVEVVLFHHVQGLTDGVRAFADGLRTGGHTVHTPDLFDGELPATVQDGIAHVQGLGEELLRDRAQEAVDDLPSDLVYAGFSFGVMMYFWLTGVAPDPAGKAIQDLASLPHKPGPLWAGLAAVVARAMQKEPARRWKSAEEMAAALAELAGETEDAGRDPEAPCRVCGKPVLADAQFCPSCVAAI